MLRDFYAFELMMAPYAIGHLRMGTLLTELGYSAQDIQGLRDQGVI